MDFFQSRFLLVFWTAVLTACGSDKLPGSEGQTESDPSIIAILNDSPDFLHDPQIAAIDGASSGEITVAYSDANLQQRVNADYVNGEWEKLKLCLQVSASPPVVLVVDGWVEAGSSDDVLFNIMGRRLATSTHRPDSTNLIRISTYDFDGSQGNPGFHLRSILGRYLWSVNELPAVGYNTGCASQF